MYLIFTFYNISILKLPILIDTQLVVPFYFPMYICILDECLQNSSLYQWKYSSVYYLLQ